MGKLSTLLFNLWIVVDYSIETWLSFVGRIDIVLNDRI
jgi:hypothetical protein